MVYIISEIRNARKALKAKDYGSCSQALKKADNLASKKMIEERTSQIKKEIQELQKQPGPNPDLKEKMMELMYLRRRRTQLGGKNKNE